MTAILRPAPGSLGTPLAHNFLSQGKLPVYSYMSLWERTETLQRDYMSSILVLLHGSCVGQVASVCSS